MEALVSLVALVGVGYGLFRGLKWLTQATQNQVTKSAPLSPSDLKVLEESATRLMADLVTITDECVARIEQVCAEAQSKIQRLESMSATSSAHPAPTAHFPTPQPQVWPAATVAATSPSLEMNTSSAVIARESGMTPGEVELMRGLRLIETRK